MRTKVYYLSKSGNVEKIAEAIAGQVGVPSEAIPPAYMPENLEFIFLGAEVNGGKVHKKMQEFIGFMGPKRTKNIVLFLTCGKDEEKDVGGVKKLIEARGIKVCDDYFVLKGKSGILGGSKKPAGEDLDHAKAFAKNIVEKFQKK